VITAVVATFTCSICGEPSHEICVFCTKDACKNHRCERCKRCSDCCECEVPLSLVEEETETQAVEPALSETAPATPRPVDPAPAEAIEERPIPYSLPELMEPAGESGPDAIAQEDAETPTVTEEARHEP
jgi:hypothetical protein